VLKEAADERGLGLMWYLNDAVGTNVATNCNFVTLEGEHLSVARSCHPHALVILQLVVERVEHSLNDACPAVWIEQQLAV